MKQPILSDHVLQVIIDGDITKMPNKTMSDKVFSFFIENDRVGATSYFLQLLQQLANGGTFEKLDTETTGNLVKSYLSKSGHSVEDTVTATKQILHNVFVH